MSLRVVQSSGKAELVPVDMPWAAWDGTKVQANLPMGIFVTIEVPLCSFADAAALKVAPVRQGVSLNVAATWTTGQHQNLATTCRSGRE
jgi:hypothetical protein